MSSNLGFGSSFALYKAILSGCPLLELFDTIYVFTSLFT